MERGGAEEEAEIKKEEKWAGEKEKDAAPLECSLNAEAHGCPAHLFQRGFWVYLWLWLQPAEVLEPWGGWGGREGHVVMAAVGSDAEKCTVAEQACHFGKILESYHRLADTEPHWSIHPCCQQTYPSPHPSARAQAGPFSALSPPSSNGEIAATDALRREECGL